MKKFSLNFSIDWKSKIIDLLIVIIGISIAFKLNTWNDSIKAKLEAQEYLESFYEENNLNLENLKDALEFSNSNKKDIDTLKQILLSRNYTDKRIKPLIGSMMTMTNFSPSTATMENISASGEFELIKDLDLRKKIIDTYNTYETTIKLEYLVVDYVDKYVTPFLFDNVRFNDFSSINSDFTTDPRFENIILGYDVLLGQQIGGYERNLEKIKLLNEKLNTAKIGKK